MMSDLIIDDAAIKSRSEQKKGWSTSIKLSRSSSAKLTAAKAMHTSTLNSRNAYEDDDVDVDGAAKQEQTSSHERPRFQTWNMVDLWLIL
jgi:hypothetical protein